MAADLTAMRLLTAGLMALAAASAQAAPLPPPARAEVDALMARLQASGCEFNRNGSWYSGAEAKAHLLNKLDYLEGKGLAQNAEQFIERAGTSSSMTGAAYQVRCPGHAVVPSAQWLKAELQALRVPHAASSPH